METPNHNYGVGIVPVDQRIRKTYEAYSPGVTMKHRIGLRELEYSRCRLMNGLKKLVTETFAFAGVPVICIFNISGGSRPIHQIHDALDLRRLSTSSQGMPCGPF